MAKKATSSKKAANKKAAKKKTAPSSGSSKKLPKSAAAKKQIKTPSADTQKMLQAIQALDMEVLQLRFKTHPHGPAAAAPRLKAPLKMAAAPAFAAAPAPAAAAGPSPAEAMAEDITGDSPSLHADPKLWRRLVQVCLLSIEQGLALNTPASEGLALSKPGDLEKYVISQEERFDLLSLHNAAFAALAAAGHALAATHAKAAATKVDSISPGDPGAASMLEDLRKLSDDIRGDQNFSTVLNLLEAAAVAYAGTPPSK